MKERERENGGRERRKLHSKERAERTTVGSPPTLSAWFGDMHHGQASDASSASGGCRGRKARRTPPGFARRRKRKVARRRASRPLSAPERGRHGRVSITRRVTRGFLVSFARDEKIRDPSLSRYVDQLVRIVAREINSTRRLTPSLANYTRAILH